MRKTCLNQIYKLAGKDPRVVFMGSDLGVGNMGEFRRDFPDRFFMEGISEANVIGMAAGMAMDGFIVYVNTIASFIVRRALDQVVVDLCMHNLPVRLVGNGGGLVYAPLGPTHQVIEDISVMRSIPNMTIVAPADADEMARLMPKTLDWPYPLYIRLAKGYDPIVTSEKHEFEIGKGVPVHYGKDVLIVTTGITMGIALEARMTLMEKGIDAGILHMHTLKPFDSKLLKEMATPVRIIVTVEEHSVLGGLGGASAEVLAEWDGFAGKRFKRLGLPDVFPEKYGSQSTLMALYGLSTENLADTVLDMASK
ncbi:transketolase family protein [Desulfonatronovibrio magnus]|uniref:transketolase family protein n=1 Tax=Desulfonatronovibrio magnus TaxID=698827 RepID=UPI0005EB88F9|nr:transketolase C-terminal domain-containing protein [Desulfonatronovibrio magnus]